MSLAAALAVCACRRSPPEAAASPDAGPSAPLAPADDTRFLDALAMRVVHEIAQSETTRDVTCWTSFRQLDSFISSSEYSNFAVLAKIDAVKALVRAAWEKASRAAAGGEVTADGLRAAVKVEATLPEGRQRELASFATDLGMKAYKDYRTTSEHWRVLLSVLEDEIDAGTTNLRPLKGDAVDALAELATRLSLRMLESAGTLARDERSPMIESTHVKRAYTALAQELGLTNTPPPPHPLSLDEAVSRLGPVTRGLVEAKIQALQTYNKDTKDLTTDLNRVSKVPLTPEAVDVWMKDLQSFTHFVAGGYEPMQADNFLFDGRYAPSTQPRVPYVDAARAENATLQLFPHVILPNGDVKLRFEPNPGAPSEHPRKAFDELMLDFRQNAIRDTAIHWIVLRNVWNEKAFAMEPFAAEYLSEVVSMMATHYVIRGEALAAARGAKTIDAALARAVRDNDYVMVMPVTQEAKGWSTEQWKAKQAVLAKYPGPLFTDATHDSGLLAAPLGAADASSPTDERGQFDIQRAMGAGVAVGDLDADGYPDVFLAGEGMGRLYLNLGKEAPGHYQDVSDAWGVPPQLDDSTGPLFFDQDGDGDLDLLVLRSGHPALLLNQVTPGHFVDAAATAGLATHRGAQVASVFDADGDGDLDVYVSYYGSDASNRQGSTARNLPSMDGRNGSPHELWRLGSDGRYTESGSAAGVAGTGWTLASSTFDYDNDGDADLFLANDFGADVFYRNKGDGTFEDVSQATRTADRGSGMNVSTTDVNGDGWLDFYVSNIDMFSKNIKVVFPNDNSTINDMDTALQKSFQYLSGNKLWVNPADPGGHKPFTAEQGARFEPGDRGWGWSAVFFDYENDGDEDMYLSTGWLEGSFAADQKKQMFLLDRGVFYLADPKSPEALASNGRSAIALDADRDGDLDLLVNDFRQPPALLSNRQSAGNHWLGVRLHGADKNTRAVGSRIRVEADGKSMIREVSCGNGYLGQNDEVLYVGVGKATTARVTIRWPRGKSKTVEAPALDRILDVQE